MSVTTSSFTTILKLAIERKLGISAHAYEKAAKQGIIIDELIATLANSEIIEDYPDAWKGPSILARHDIDGVIIHAVWGIPKAFNEPATLITCYRPDPEKWNQEFRKRKTLQKK